MGCLKLPEGVKVKRIISISTGLVVLLLVYSLNVQAADMYRWVDSRGIVHYSDVPSANAEKVNPGKFSGKPGSGEDLPYAARIAQQNFPVTLYVGYGCGATCDQARSLLNKRGIPYAEKTLRTKEDIDAFKKLTNSEAIPTLAVGKTLLKGLQAEQWNGELDIAGYPKIAPYRAPNTEPAAEQPSEPAPENPDVQESPANQ